MSYTTRCPACGTMFKVVPDQLKISDGWVRCGHCADVFDARLYLEVWTPPAPAPAAAPAPVADPNPVFAPEAVVAAPEPEATPVEPAPEPAPEVPVRASDKAWFPVESVAEPPITQALVVAAAVRETLAVDPQRPDTPGDGAPPAPRQTDADFHAELERFAAVSSGAVDRIRVDPTQASDPMPAALVEPQDAGAPIPDEPGFVRQAKRQAFWRSPGVRAALGVLGVLLALLLAAQWALHERDRLAASHPDLAPLLARLCEPLGCAIGPVQRIDAVVIDSSTLVRRLGNFYSFDIVLKNTAALPVAVPALELSLTDARDSVIARRVFLPQELPGAPRLLPAQDQLALSLRLSITEIDAVPMAGYRALVFYP